MRLKSSSRLPCLLLALWALQSLPLLYFHAPWRDEAQAWLVAKSAVNVWELWWRASVEASGPLYYTLLWPAAKMWPAAFPLAIKVLSWLGAFLCARELLCRRLLPLPVAALVAFSYLFGYEFAVVSRLYGWGAFFLLWGMRLEAEKKFKRSALALGLSSLTQLSFAFAAASFCLYRILRGARALTVPLGAGALSLLSWWHLRWSARTRAWGHFDFHKKLSGASLGSTLAVPFLPNFFRLGWAGYVVPLLGLWEFDGPARLAFLPLVFLFFASFTWASLPGVAEGRHAGALFLIFIFLAHEVAKKRGRLLTRAAWVFLGLSFLIGIVARYREISLGYSDSVRTAQAVRAAAKGRPFRFFVNEDYYGFALSALLDQPLRTGAELAPVPYPAFTQERAERLRLEGTRTPWEEIARACDLSHEECFVVLKRSDPGPPPNAPFELLEEAHPRVTDESFRLYRVKGP